MCEDRLVGPMAVYQNEYKRTDLLMHPETKKIFIHHVLKQLNSVQHN